MVIFLDESGDLGFDFTKAGTSRYFVITLLVAQDQSDASRIRRAVARTMRQKVHGRKGAKRQASELKGAKTDHSTKQHFWRQVSSARFALLAIALNKRRVHADLRQVPERLYNYLARFVIDQLQLKGVTDLSVVLDRSKSRAEINDFNQYLRVHLQAVIDPTAKLRIDHSISHEDKGLQAADLFAWGFFRKHERQDTEWYNLFRKRVVFETVYLP